MTSWILLTLVTTLLWAFCNVFDQIAVTRYLKNEYRYSYLFYLARLPLFFVLVLLFGLEVPSQSVVWLTLLMAFINGLAFLFYYRAMRLSPAYVVALLYVALHPVFVLLIKTAYFGNDLSSGEYVGFFLLLCAGILSVLECDAKLTINKGALWVIPSTFMWSLGDVMWDYVIGSYSRPVNFLPWMALGAFFVVFIFLGVPSLRKKSLDTTVTLPGTAHVLFTVTLITIFVSYGTFSAALALGDVALTSAMTAVQPLFVFLIGLVLARFVYNNTVSSRITFFAIIPKLAALICAVAGVYLIAP